MCVYIYIYILFEARRKGAPESGGGLHPHTIGSALITNGMYVYMLYIYTLIYVFICS